MSYRRIITIEIEVGIPIPPKSATRVRETVGGTEQFKYPWKKMEKGHSFFVPLLDGRSMRQHHVNIISASFAAGKRNNAEYVTRIATKKGKKGVRVWRTS